MECDYEIDFKELTETGYTLQNPLGKLIGIEDLDDWSMTDEELDRELSEMLEEDFHFNDIIPSGKFELQVEIDGTFIHKATCVKQALSI